MMSTRTSHVVRTAVPLAAAAIFYLIPGNATTTNSALASSTDSSTASASVLSIEQIETPSPARVALMCGVTPDSAAAIGMNPSQLDLVLGYCSLHTAEAQECLQIDAHIRGLREYIDSLLHGALVYGVTDGLSQTVSENRATIEQLQEERDGIFDELNGGLRQLVASQLGGQSVDLMNRFNANAERRVPSAHRCLDLTDRQWDALASALDKSEINNAAVSDESIESLPLTDTEEAVLSLAENSQTVAAAQNGLAQDTNALAHIFELYLTSE